MRKIIITSLLCGLFITACSRPGNSPPTDAAISDANAAPVSPASNNTPSIASGTGVPAARAIDDAAAAQVQNENPLAPPTGFVNDYAKVIDARTKQRLEATLKKFQEKSKIDFLVAVVDTTGAQASADYAIAVARGWGVGTKEQSAGGIILLVAIKDRRWEIRWTRKLDADLEDGTGDELTRQMTDLFRQGQYGEGITNGVNAVISKIANKRGFSL